MAHRIHASALTALALAAASTQGTAGENPARLEVDRGCDGSYAPGDVAVVIFEPAPDGWVLVTAEDPAGTTTTLLEGRVHPGGESSIRLDPLGLEGAWTVRISSGGEEAACTFLVTPEAAAAPPAFSCCEQNIALRVPTKQTDEWDFDPKKSGTSLVNGLWREIHVVYQFHLEFDCAPQDKDPCIGKFDVAVNPGPPPGVPTQGGNAPMSSNVQVTKAIEDRCGTGHHVGDVEVRFDAIYAGTGPVAGNLVLDLSLNPPTKGTIDHRFTATVTAATVKKKEVLESTNEQLQRN